MSITRFTFIMNLDLKSPDITWNFVNVQIWTGVESHIGITCGKSVLSNAKRRMANSNAKHVSHAFAQSLILSSSVPSIALNVVAVFP